MEAMALRSGRENTGRRGARDLLLDAAEELFARRGIDGVSLREIASAAGQRNNSAVSYHFRDKQGLIDALIVDRMGRVEDARAQLVARAGDLEELGVGELLTLLWQPVIDLGQAKAVNWYIHFRFTGQLRSASANGATEFYSDAHPASRRLHRELSARCPHLKHEQFTYRLNLVAMMFWSALSWHDNLALSTNQTWSSRFCLDEVIKMAAPALLAPG
jgi:AcrR family transcriptional regulator